MKTHVLGWKGQSCDRILLSVGDEHVDGFPKRNGLNEGRERLSGWARFSPQRSA